MKATCESFYDTNYRKKHGLKLCREWVRGNCFPLALCVTDTYLHTHRHSHTQVGSTCVGAQHPSQANMPLMCITPRKMMTITGTECVLKTRGLRPACIK